MTIALSYVRFSTDAQHGGDSLRRQTAMSQAYAEKHGLTLVESFSDLGLSGFKSAHRRGAMGRLLEAVHDGSIQPGTFLLVESLDRLSREPVVTALNLLMNFIEAGLTVVTLQDEIQYSREVIDGDWTKLIISLSKMAAAHEESAKKSKRLRDQRTHARTQLATRKLTSVCPAWLRYDRPSDSFLLIEDRAAVVRDIFARIIRGEGQAYIAKVYNREGVPTVGRANGGWHATRVGQIVHSRATIGEFQAHRCVSGTKGVPDGDPVGDYFPPVVDPATFAAAQTATAERRRNGGGRLGPDMTNLFQKVVICAACNGPMTVRKPGLYRYLQCSAATRSRGCEERTMHRLDRVEAVFADWVREVRMPRPTDQADPLRSELENAQARRDDLKTRIARLIDALEMGEAVADRMMMRKADLRRTEAEIADLSGRVEAADRARAGKPVGESLRDALAGGESRIIIAGLVRRFVETMRFTDSGFTVVLREGGILYSLDAEGRGWRSPSPVPVSAHGRATVAA